MERTELREAFFAEVQNDPYAHMVTHLCARMWAEGYEQALRDNGLTEEYRSKSFSERTNDAVEFLTDKQREAEANALIAFAQLGEEFDARRKVAEASSRYPTSEEIKRAEERLRPYLDGYPEPMIDARRLRISNGTASEQDRREIAAEDVVLRRIRGKAAQ